MTHARHPLAVTALLLLGAGAASAGTASLSAVHWDTDDLDEAFGGGLALTFPLGTVVDLDLRAAYFEELTAHPIDALFDSDDPVFERNSVQIAPVELGLRFTKDRDSGTFHPYVGGGVSYYALDSPRPEVQLDDEIGYYGLLGSRFGDGNGADFFVEGIYHKVEATAERDPGSLIDIGDLELDNSVEIDLDGVSVAAGLVWTW